MRTSASHPLKIAEVSAGAGFGQVGVTFCPGKKDPTALTGAWDRDIDIDLDAVRDWGASAVVTLLEPTELLFLNVPTLGAEVLRRQMLWFHLPIVDVSTPDTEFELAWKVAGATLRALLRNGSNVLVHCRGGLGRAGLIAARLLVELGLEPGVAISMVRKARPGAIQTPEQEDFVSNIRLVL